MSEFEAYRGLFVAESRENHENLVKNLLLLELGSYQEAIDEIFRSIHTLKGASASMGFSAMEHLCHTMEDVFSLIRSGSADISPDLVNLLLACSDLIEQMLDDIESGGDSSSKNAETEINSLRQWIERHGVKPEEKEECQKIPIQEELPPETLRIIEGDYCQEYEDADHCLSRVHDEGCACPACAGELKRPRNHSFLKSIPGSDRRGEV